MLAESDRHVEPVSGLSPPPPRLVFIMAARRGLLEEWLSDSGMTQD